MAGPMDPPHERVVLTSAERRAVDRLELALFEVDSDSFDGVLELRSRGRRLRRSWRALLRRCGRAAFWLLSLGTLLTVATVSVSLVAALAGVVLSGFGLAGYLQRARR